MFLSTLRSLTMLIYANAQIFLTLLLYWTSLGVSLKWPEQILVSKHENYKGENTT